MAIKWDTSWNTNIAVIDQKNRRLVNIVSDFGDAMRVGKSKEVVNDVLTVMVNYTNTHFRAEEKLMETAKYIDIDAHKMVHKQFVDKITEYKKKVDAGSTLVSVEMFAFLSDWFIKHVKGEDMKYVPYIKTKVS